MTAQNCLGRPWAVTEPELQAANISYVTVLTQPPQKSKIFPLDESCLYVLRVKEIDENKWELTLAARAQSKESSVT